MFAADNKFGKPRDNSIHTDIKTRFIHKDMQTSQA